MTINKRLSEVCKSKKIRQVDLVNFGLGSKQTINSIMQEKQNPSCQFIESFLKAYPDVNARWLLTGDGNDINIAEEPRSEYGYCRECIKKDGVIEYLKKEILGYIKKIALLQERVEKCEHQGGEGSQAESNGRKAS